MSTPSSSLLTWEYSYRFMDVITAVHSFMYSLAWRFAMTPMLAFRSPLSQLYVPRSRSLLP